MRLAPLFAERGGATREFHERHDARARARAATSWPTQGTAFLGIDAGSTTFKAALIGEDGRACCGRTYANNKGDVLGCAEAAADRAVRTRCRATPRRASRS